MTDTDTAALVEECAQAAHDYLTSCCLDTVANEVRKRILETAALSRPAPAAEVPEGWKLMPPQPDVAMWQAGREADANPGDSYTKVYCAMFDASPPQPDAKP